MNSKSTFNRNFDLAIQKLTGCAESDVENFHFSLIPINEDKGELSSKDYWMKYAVLKNNSLEVVKRL